MEVVYIRIYNIPKNYEDNMITASGKSFRNVVEAVLFLGIFVLIFAFLPIPLKAKVILITMLGGPAAVFGYIGIKRYSVLEYIGLVIKYKTKQNTFNFIDMFQEKEQAELQVKEVKEAKENKKNKNKNKNIKKKEVNYEN